MTTGTTNLTNVTKEPKNLFYHRKCLRDLGLVRVVCITQSLGGRGVKSLLLRLNRFHQPVTLSVPKVGRMHKVIEYLRGCPNYSAKSDILLSMRFFTQPQTKKMRKSNNIFEFVSNLFVSKLFKFFIQSQTIKSNNVYSSIKTTMANHLARKRSPTQRREDASVSTQKATNLLSQMTNLQKNLSNVNLKLE